MVDRLSTVHHDNQGSFSSNEVDQELEESVYGKSLVQVSSRYWKMGFG
jgi:hypothetical protein